ncbi:hypothetical protein CYMTET_18284 [Cymbomonas tetramitiformis]|uniref:Uncharacterized protein n=1 Tax=Cymbomonas tetramitiformis TaxID=36881 RepID=A0AAE0G8F9_9CHLO|nr:hypothetical protein CYMTET_18284 [Cymbomonas tetramitiformis]
MTSPRRRMNQRVYVRSEDASEEEEFSPETCKSPTLARGHSSHGLEEARNSLSVWPSVSLERAALDELLRAQNRYSDRKSELFKSSGSLDTPEQSPEKERADSRAHTPSSPRTARSPKVTLSWPIGCKRPEPRQVGTPGTPMVAPRGHSVQPVEDMAKSSAPSYRKMKIWMEREVAAARERSEALEEQLRCARREIAATRDMVQNAQEDAEAAEKLAETACTQKATLHKNMVACVEAARGQAESSVNELHTVEQEVQALKRKTNAEQQLINRLQSELASAIESGKKMAIEADRGTDELQQIHRSAIGHQQRAEHAEREVEIARAEMAQWRTTALRIEAVTSETEAEAAVARAQLTESSQLRILNVESEVAAARHTASRVEAEAGEWQRQAEVAQASERARAHASRSAEEMAQRSRRHSERVEAELAQQAEELQTARAELSVQRAMAAEARSQYSEQVDVAQELRGDLSQARAVCHTLEAQGQSLRQEMAEALEAKEQVVKVQAAATREHAKRLTAANLEMSNREEEATTARREARRLQSRLRDAKEEAQRLEAMLANPQQEPVGGVPRTKGGTQEAWGAEEQETVQRSSKQTRRLQARVVALEAERAARAEAHAVLEGEVRDAVEAVRRPCERCAAAAGTDAATATDRVHAAEERVVQLERVAEDARKEFVVAWQMVVGLESKLAKVESAEASSRGRLPTEGGTPGGREAQQAETTAAKAAIQEAPVLERQLAEVEAGWERARSEAEAAVSARARAEQAAHAERLQRVSQAEELARAQADLAEAWDTSAHHVTAALLEQDEAQAAFKVVAQLQAELSAEQSAAEAWRREAQDLKAGERHWAAAREELEERGRVAMGAQLEEAARGARQTAEVQLGLRNALERVQSELAVAREEHAEGRAELAQQLEETTRDADEAQSGMQRIVEAIRAELAVAQRTSHEELVAAEEARVHCAEEAATRSERTVAQYRQARFELEDQLEAARQEVGLAKGAEAQAEGEVVRLREEVTDLHEEMQDSEERAVHVLEVQQQAAEALIKQVKEDAARAYHQACRGGGGAAEAARRSSIEAQQEAEGLRAALRKLAEAEAAAGEALGQETGSSGEVGEMPNGQSSEQQIGQAALMVAVEGAVRKVEELRARVQAVITQTEQLREKAGAGVLADISGGEGGLEDIGEALETMLGRVEEVGADVITSKARAVRLAQRLETGSLAEKEWAQRAEEAEGETRHAEARCLLLEIELGHAHGRVEEWQSRVAAGGEAVEEIESTDIESSIGDDEDEEEDEDEDDDDDEDDVAVEEDDDAAAAVEEEGDAAVEGGDHDAVEEEGEGVNDEKDRQCVPRVDAEAADWSGDEVSPSSSVMSAQLACSERDKISSWRLLEGDLPHGIERSESAKSPRRSPRTSPRTPPKSNPYALPTDPDAQSQAKRHLRLNDEDDAAFALGSPHEAQPASVDRVRQTPFVNSPVPISPSVVALGDSVAAAAQLPDNFIFSNLVSKWKSVEQVSDSSPPASPETARSPARSPKLVQTPKPPQPPH